MIFIAPIWLFGLLPWAGVLAYLLTGRRRGAAVPFLALWKGVASMPRPRTVVHRPPWFVLLMLGAMLLGVLAAAGPMLRAAGNAPLITVVLDRGVTMSPVVKSEAFRGVIALVQPELSRRFHANSAVDLVSVPGRVERTTLAGWAGEAAKLPPTAAETKGMIEAAVAARLRDSSGPVLVLSDQTVAVSSQRIVRIAPVGAVHDVGISALSARREPASQVMVRLRNHSTRDSAMLVVTSGTQRTERRVMLAKNGGTRDEFIDFVGGLADSVHAEIDGNDDAPVNDRAWLVRESAWPILEPRAALPAGLQRMVDIYTKRRPGSANSMHIALVDRELPAGESGLWFVRAGNEGAGGESKRVNVTTHALTREVGRWPAPVDARATLPAGYSAVVSSGDGLPLVAVREQPARQAWVNLDLEQWSREPDFVIFLSGAFDWLGGGSAADFVGHPIELLGSEWRRSEDLPAPSGVENGIWPGLYRRDDGALRAVNSPDVKWEDPVAGDWRGQLERQAAGVGEAGRSLRTPTCLLAMLCAMAAMLAGPGRARRNAIFLSRAQDRRPERV